jgi:hypothetical protein
MTMPETRDARMRYRVCTPQDYRGQIVCRANPAAVAWCGALH